MALDEKHALAGQLLHDANHECNNQLAYILSNLQNLVEYADDLSRIIAAYRKRIFAAGLQDAELHKLETEADLDFVLEDLGRAARDGLLGATRLRDILRVLARVSEDEPGERPVVEVERVLSQVLGFGARAIALRARLDAAPDTGGSVAGAPALVTRALVVMLRHALATFDSDNRKDNHLRVFVERPDGGGRLAIVFERRGGREAAADGLELAEQAAQELGARLLIEPMRVTLSLVEIPS